MEIPGARFRRRIAEVGAAAALVAVTATPALAAPSPSPRLDSGLVAPTDSAFVEASSSDGYLDGPLTAGAWSGDDIRMLDLLRRDHFVSGFARSYVDTKGKRFVFEAAAAFNGKTSATDFLAYFQASPTDDNYSRAIVLTGVDSFVGAHFADPKKPAYWDVGVFVKGNDLYTVFCESATDTLGDMCSSLAQRQFEAAPQFTLPPSVWPENASRNATTSSGNSQLLTPVLIVVAALVIAGVLALVVVIIVLARRRGTAPEPQAAGGPQMSADGRYWWDGQAWRDAEQHMPAGAMRSADGYYWWDGQAWRMAPRPA